VKVGHPLCLLPPCPLDPGVGTETETDPASRNTAVSRLVIHHVVRHRRLVTIMHMEAEKYVVQFLLLPQEVGL